jgi:hypothetical protein
LSGTKSYLTTLPVPSFTGTAPTKASTIAIDSPDVEDESVEEENQVSDEIKLKKNTRKVKPTNLEF